MNKELYAVIGIKFPCPDIVKRDLVVGIPQSVWGMGVEDFEEDGFSDEVDDMDEENADAFWDDYEGSDEAHAKFDEAFTAEVLHCVREHLPNAIGFETFRPATFEDWRTDADRELTRLYAVDTVDLECDENRMETAFNRGEAPAKWAKWFGDKYDLTPKEYQNWEYHVLSMLDPDAWKYL